MRRKIFRDGDFVIQMFEEFIASKKTFLKRIFFRFKVENNFRKKSKAIVFFFFALIIIKCLMQQEAWYHKRFKSIPSETNIGSETLWKNFSTLRNNWTFVLSIFSNNFLKLEIWRKIKTKRKAKEAIKNHRPCLLLDFPVVKSVVPANRQTKG